MMKITKHISILLALLLLVSNIGLSFDVHYCGNNIASVSLKSHLSKDNLEVNCCGVSEKKSSCCKDKLIKFEKKSDNFIVTSFDFQCHFDFLIQAYHFLTFAKITNFKNSKVVSYTYNANAPPIYKRNCQLIFYA
jgi:hypothetical protein